MSFDKQQLMKIVEGAIFAEGKALSVDKLIALFEAEDKPSKEEVQEALAALQEHYQDRGIELKEVSTGFRFQVVQAMAPWVGKLWEERPAKYTRALLETLALIAYRQPITRAEIEDVRGVAVSSNVIKTLMDREWVKVLGHREVPGRPGLYGTTKAFLDYFNLKSISDLPPLSELVDLDQLATRLGEQVDPIVADAIAQAQAVAAMDVEAEQPADTASEQENECDTETKDSAVEEQEHSETHHGELNQGQVENPASEIEASEETIEIDCEQAIMLDPDVEEISEQDAADDSDIDLASQEILAEDIVEVDSESQALAEARQDEEAALLEEVATDV